MSNALYLSEIKVGDKFVTARQTISEATVVLFAGITGDFHPTHMDEEYAKTLPFGGRIAHGLLTASVAMALWTRLGVVEESAICQLGCSWQFRAPVKFGDTIHAEIEVVEVRRSNSKPDRGILTTEMKVYNHRGELTVINKTDALIKWERPEGGAAPAICIQ